MTSEVSKTRISCYLIIKTINHSDLEPYLPTGLECLYPKMTFVRTLKLIQAIPNMPNPITETEVNNFLESKLNMHIASIDEEGYPMIQPIWFDYDKESGKIHKSNRQKVWSVNSVSMALIAIAKIDPSML